MLSHALINHIVLRKAVLFLVASSNRAINLLARAELHLSVNTATASATSHNVAHWQATSAAPAPPTATPQPGHIQIDVNAIAIISKSISIKVLRHPHSLTPALSLYVYM